MEKISATYLAKTGFALALVAISALLMAALGHAWGWWGFRPAFGAIRWIAYGGLLAAALALVGGVASIQKKSRIGMVLGLVGIAVGVTSAWVPYANRMALRASPRLSDITTDMVNPPNFIAALELRKKSKARNKTSYGPAKAKLQKLHYPDIKPATLALPPGQAFDKALAVVHGLGWAIIASDKAARRIEASETSFWFGFVDDVVIRIAPAGADGKASRVDVRSSSRIGRRDAKVNANRVRNFLAKIKAR